MSAILRKAQYILLICLVFSFPFSLDQIKLNSYLIILVSLNTLLLFFFSKNETRSRVNGLLVLFISIYLFHLFGLFKTDNLHEAIFELQKKLSILLFPILLYFSPRFTYKEIRIIMLSFVFSCLLTGIFCLLTATYRYFLLADSSFFFYHDLSAIAGMHATYLSMYFCFSIAILLCIYSNDLHNFNLRNRIIYFSSLFILTLAVLLLGARTQISIIVIGAIVYFSYCLNRKNNLIKSVFIGIAVGIFILGAVFLFPTNRERFKEAFNYNIGNRWGEQQIRYLIWSSALELVKMHPIKGVGTGDVQDELHKYYLDHEYVSLTYFNNTQFNAHNQFLETAIGLGIPGLILLLICFIATLLYAFRHNNTLYFIFILLFIISCMTESLLERQSGIVFYAFFNSFLYFNLLTSKSNYASYIT